MTLCNPVESLGNVKFSDKHGTHGTRIGDLVAPGASWKNRAAVKKAIEEGR